MQHWRGTIRDKPGFWKEDGEVNDEIFRSKGDSQYRICIFLDVLRVVMRGCTFPTGLSDAGLCFVLTWATMRLFSGCTITVKFNANDGQVFVEDFSSMDDPCTGLLLGWPSCCDARKYFPDRPDSDAGLC